MLTKVSCCGNKRWEPSNNNFKGIKTNGPYIMAYDKKGFYKKRTSAKCEA